MAKSKFSVGDRVYEVFLYKIRPARITSVKRIRLDDPVRSRVFIYEILCEDNTPSPRYYESDFGKVLFIDELSAKAQLDENLRFKSQLGGREMYDTQGSRDKVLIFL